MADKKELYGYEEEDIITFEFDDETAEECGILGVFDALGKEYIAFNPLGTEDVYIYGYKELDEDYELIDINRRRGVQKGRCRVRETGRRRSIGKLILRCMTGKRKLTTLAGFSYNGTV
ncbi:MAG: hypothetical protein V8R14_07335 [Clostridia bacterium]